MRTHFPIYPNVLCPRSDPIINRVLASCWCKGFILSDAQMSGGDHTLHPSSDRTALVHRTLLYLSPSKVRET